MSEVPQRSLVAYLFDRAESAEVAFTYLDCSEGRDAEPVSISWAEVVRRVRAVAAAIREVAEPGDRVAVVSPQDLNYVIGFLGALAAGVIAVPLFAPEVVSQRRRLVGALDDCGARVWLTSAAAREKLAEFIESEPVQAPDQVISVDGVLLPAKEHGVLLPAEVRAGDVAYLQYTSGSTREPAGAMITHGALTASCWQLVGAFDLDEGFTYAGWLPFFHDMGLMQFIGLPVFTGGRSVFIKPLEFVRRPARWLRLMADYPSVMTSVPNFAFDYVLETVPERELDGLDLSGVRVALNGSEPIRPATVAAFDKAFGPRGFSPTAHRPAYGLAEATVYVASAGPEGPTVTAFDSARLASGRAVAAPGGRELVSVGRPVRQLVRIVAADTRRVCPDGEVGEIWIHGPHLAAGYWGQPERTAEVFDAHLEDGLPADGWLRSGDLGVVHDGQLYITGRIKDLIIIDGRNHYPQDIEATVADAHPAVRRGRVAAFEVTDERGTGVVVVGDLARESSPELDHAQVARAVRAAVSAQHELRLRDFRLLPSGSVPRTSSGKVARTAARQLYFEHADEGR